jgi:tRNA (cmo5U34)-methyltransferase
MSFADAAMIADYAEVTPRKVPGLSSLHRMAMLLLAESAPHDAKMLVLGAGGGLELKAFAEQQPSWTFVGIDPSAAMLELAVRTLGPLGKQVQLQQGYIDSAPTGPFDGATCLLMLHFLKREERLQTLRELRRRMKPGAPIVVAHHSYPEGGDVRRWLFRSATFAEQSSFVPDRLSASVTAMAERLPILPADQDRAVLEEAGFCNVELFYAALSFRGWVASA